MAEPLLSFPTPSWFLKAIQKGQALTVLSFVLEIVFRTVQMLLAGRAVVRPQAAIRGTAWVAAIELVLIAKKHAWLLQVRHQFVGAWLSDDLRGLIVPLSLPLVCFARRRVIRSLHLCGTDSRFHGLTAGPRTAICAAYVLALLLDVFPDGWFYVPGGLLSDSLTSMQHLDEGAAGIATIAAAVALVLISLFRSIPASSFLVVAALAMAWLFTRALYMGSDAASILFYCRLQLQVILLCIASAWFCSIRRGDGPVCIGCGYTLFGLPESSSCPECGWTR